MKFILVCAEAVCVIVFADCLVLGVLCPYLLPGIIYATRGTVEKGMQRMGRGRSGKMFTRTSHLRVRGGLAGGDVWWAVNEMGHSGDADDWMRTRIADGR